MANPVLVEVTRGRLVESVHRGALAIVSADGSVRLQAGSVAHPVFARSAIKLVQALPMVESGACERFGFGHAEIALACGSHTGTPRHVSIAGRMAERLGVDQTCLVCGVAAPAGNAAARSLAASGAKPTALHHTCSGKHLGFIAAALAMGETPSGYGQPGHRVQRAVVDALVNLSGCPIDAIETGMDGCGVATFGLPLANLARVFAQIADGSGQEVKRRDAIKRILAACWTEPELVSGAGRTDTVVLSALPGVVYMKSGAEGVYCGALPKVGLGFAMKIDDGTARASAAAVMPLIERLLPEARGLVNRSVLQTASGVEVGAIRNSAEYHRLLDLIGPAPIAVDADTTGTKL